MSGLVRVPNGNLRTFSDYRQIKRGKNRDRFEVKIFTPSKQKKIIVGKENIWRFPEK